MLHKVETKYLDGMAFESDVNGHKVMMDAFKEFGGEDRGSSPKKLLLASLAGCTGMDVVSLLRKMRVEYSGYTMEVEANLTDEHPKIYDTITIKYIFSGVKEEDYAKVEKAVSLSKERYCGVSAMLAKAADIKFEIMYK